MSVKQMNLDVKDDVVVFMLYSAIEAEGKSKRSTTISGMKERSRAISGLIAPTLRCHSKDDIKLF